MIKIEEFQNLDLLAFDLVKKGLITNTIWFKVYSKKNDFDYMLLKYSTRTSARYSISELKNYYNDKSKL